MHIKWKSFLHKDYLRFFYFLKFLFLFFSLKMYFLINTTFTFVFWWWHFFITLFRIRKVVFIKCIIFFIQQKRVFDCNWHLNPININLLSLFNPKIHFYFYLNKNELFNSSTSILYHVWKDFHDYHPICSIKVTY